MFAGIIQQLGSVVSVQKKADSVNSGFRFVLQVSERQVGTGESVAIDGVCLTIIGKKRRFRSLPTRSGRRGSKKSYLLLTLEVAEETAKKTTLKEIFRNRVVNVEWPLEIGQNLGGHFVQGHVDGTGRILKIQQAGNSKLYWFSYPAFLQSCLVPKGSVAVDGISLTLVDVCQESFSVAILPFTEKNTSLQFKKIGDEVNLEADILAKTIAWQFQNIRKEIFKGDEFYQRMEFNGMN